MAETKGRARAKQFPAKAGDVAGEVSERSAGSSDGTRFVREFVVLGSGSGHAAHFLATVTEAIQRGLHPKGDVSFDGATTHGDGVSTVLTYSVETVPASVDHASGDTTVGG